MQNNTFLYNIGDNYYWRNSLFKYGMENVNDKYNYINN